MGLVGHSWKKMGEEQSFLQQNFSNDKWCGK
jgi:hypothetical protein